MNRILTVIEINKLKEEAKLSEDFLFQTLNANQVRKDTIRLLNLKDKKCRKLGAEKTSKDTYLSSAFERDENLN